ncbi:MAG: hypothetical protein P8Y94_00675 [Acidobacteriota bacterium]
MQTLQLLVQILALLPVSRLAAYRAHVLIEHPPPLSQLVRCLGHRLIQGKHDVDDDQDECNSYPADDQNLPIAL